MCGFLRKRKKILKVSAGPFKKTRLPKTCKPLSHLHQPALPLVPGPKFQEPFDSFCRVDAFLIILCLAFKKKVIIKMCFISKVMWHDKQRRIFPWRFCFYTCEESNTSRESGDMLLMAKEANKCHETVLYAHTAGAVFLVWCIHHDVILHNSRRSPRSSRSGELLSSCIPQKKKKKNTDCKQTWVTNILSIKQIT